MSRKSGSWWVYGAIAAVVIVAVLWLGGEYSAEAREFLRNLLRAL